MFLNSNKFIFIILILILIIYSYSSIITIPFRIIQYESSQNQILEKKVEDQSFYFKILSIIDIGTPSQKIETSFNLKSPNLYISNQCRNCSSFYSYKSSNSFIKINTDIKPIGFGNQIYANETFIFYDGNNNRQKKVEKLLIYLPEMDDEESENNKNMKNCLNIGLKFPGDGNNFQKTFLQQLKSNNIINKYFWTMTFYDNKYNKDYDGAFIFGDILNDYYPQYTTDFTPDNIIYTYAGNKKKNKNNKNINLEWGIHFDEIYYEFKNESINNIMFSHNTITEFNIDMNIVLSPFDYFRSIQRDFFNYYYINNICKYSFMRGSMYKFIYCHTANFTLKDLVKFPSINFKNRILRYIFTLNYKELFSLTNDKKYYMFNIVVANVYRGDNNEDTGQWILGLPFFKKYQFSFDTDNKLIYYYNKEGIFLDEEIQINEEDNDDDDYNDINDREKDIRIENENDGNDIEINNHDRIISNNKKKKNEIYVDEKVQKIIFIFVLVIIFLFFFYCLLLLVRKILFKHGYVLMRIKKANELNDDFDYSSSKNSNLIQNENKSKFQECEMQIK